MTLQTNFKGKNVLACSADVPYEGRYWPILRNREMS
jgi:hypothetical protein